MFIFANIFKKDFDIYGEKNAKNDHSVPHGVLIKIAD